MIAAASLPLQTWTGIVIAVCLSIWALCVIANCPPED